MSLSRCRWNNICPPDQSIIGLNSRSHSAGVYRYLYEVALGSINTYTKARCLPPVPSTMAEAHTSIVLYPLALLNVMKSKNDPLLGVAERLGIESSAFKVPAHRFLHALIEQAPSPVTIASEFLIELEKCGNTAVITLGTQFRSST